MAVLILGILLFLGPHSARMAYPGLRQKIIDARGEPTWKAVAGVSGLVGIGLIIWGWILAWPTATLYTPPDWGRHVTTLCLWIGLVLLFMNVNNAGRVVTWVKHPAVTAVFFWSFGHLFANGEVGSVLLFGAFALWALADRISFAVRGGPDPEFKGYVPDIIGLVGGTIVFLVLYYWAHEFMFGVAPGLS